MYGSFTSDEGEAVKKKNFPSVHVSVV